MAIPFSEFMADALYGPAGFYTTGGRAGRRGDFMTSPEVGPLFGAVVAQFLDTEWQRLGRPDPFTVVDAGAGPGTLARSVLAAAPECSAAMRYVAVDVSDSQRAQHPDGIESMATMPDGPFDGVIIANELLDNLPFRLAVHDDGWREAFVVELPDGRLVEQLSARFDPVPSVLPGVASLGARAPIQNDAHDWVADAYSHLRSGTLIAIDYASVTTAGLALRPWRDWLRTYRGHARGEHYLAQPGSQDITTEVAIDQLPEPDAVRSQAQWLQLHGIIELVAEGKRYWEVHAAHPDLAAIKMRSRVSEAEALLDRAGLGGFTVLEWRAGACQAHSEHSGRGDLRWVVMSDEHHDTIDALMAENRKFPPSDAFRAASLVSDTSLYDEAAIDDEGFWARQAADLVRWSKPWDTILDWQLPYAKWFIGGELNVADNCLDRHVEAGNGDKVAIHWEGEPGDTRAITYAELLTEVSQFANVLKGLGVQKGDRINIYMPMIPEAAVAMLACARIGAPHSVVFGGFSAQSLADRIDDAAAKVLITADGGYRRGVVFPLKQACDEAVANTSTIEHVVVVKRGGNEVTMVEGRDHWYHELMQGASADCPAEPMDSEDLLFLLYTSGTTGKPKGIMHTTGGYLTHVTYTHKYVFDLDPTTDVFWCTADVGWITGHSYIVYGPLSNGCTQVMYEGVPNYPANDRFWEIVEKYQVTKFYTAPTAIRTFMKWGADEPAKHDLSSLKLIGTVGEPINPEAWMWYHEQIGHGRCPIVDTWWQTETGGIMISPLPGATTTKPGSATFPIPGVSAELVDDDANVVTNGGGYLTLTRPWPGMLRGIWGDPQRYEDTYWSRFEGRYFAGDGAKLDDDGYLWLLGRVDDVMNVSGHRISTTEVESALVSHPAVAEAAVVGANDPTTGQAIFAYVILRGGAHVSVADLRDHVASEIGAIAKPKAIFITPDLPKTRSGKIMRRLLRDVAEGRNLGDTTTLADATVVDELQRRAADGGGDD